jgi:hypothetical protein
MAITLSVATEELWKDNNDDWQSRAPNGIVLSHSANWRSPSKHSRRITRSDAGLASLERIRDGRRQAADHGAARRHDRKTRPCGKIRRTTNDIRLAELRKSLVFTAGLCQICQVREKRRRLRMRDRAKNGQCSVVLVVFAMSSALMTFYLNGISICFCLRLVMRPKGNFRVMFCRQKHCRGLNRTPTAA